MRKVKNVGIDIGKKKCNICVMDQDGTVLEESAYVNLRDKALKFATESRKKYGPCRAVCESTGNHWIKTADVFEEAGVPLDLANPFKIKAIAWASVKNDKVDARMLAHLLRSNLIPRCHTGSAESRGIKQMIRYQRILIQDRVKAINFLHSLTDKYDVDPKKGGCHVWNKKSLTYLGGVSLDDPSDQLVLERCVSKIRYYTGEIGKLDVAITSYVRGNHAAKLLLSITGIDTYAAALLASEIDGIERFDDPRKLVSWAGMCPTLHQSGETEYHGKMKKDSNRKVNWIMIQCAFVAAVHDPRMKSYYERLKARHRPQVAVTHVANKMLTIIWHMLTENKTYEGAKKPLYQSKLKKVMG